MPPYSADGAPSRTGGELAQRTRAEQGLTPHVVDDVALAQVAALLNAITTAESRKTAWSR